MAKPAWITVDPMSGSGNGTIRLTASAFTGRSNRTGTVTVTTAGGKTATVSCTQTAKAAFVTAGQAVSIGASTTTAKVQFTTNCKAFKLTTTGGTISAVTANGSTVSASSGIYTPSGDPGASAQYVVEVTLTIPANTAVTSKAYTVTFTDSTSTTITGSVKVTQAAAASNISVSPTSATFVATGEAKSISVTSNDSWTVS